MDYLYSDKMRVDFLIENKICVEMKAVSYLENNHFAQAKNNLEAFNLQIALLINFGASSLEWKRIFNNKFRQIKSSEN